MSTSRRLTTSNIGRKKAMNTAVAKYNSVLPADSAISDTTAARLVADNTSYDNAMSAVDTAEETQRTAHKTVVANRGLLHTNISCYLQSLNIGIRLGVIPDTARALYGLDVGNKKMPDIDTDINLLYWANQIVVGDAKRVGAGGFVITLPTIAAFTTVYTDTKTSITAFSTSKDALAKAHVVVNNLNTEADNIIVRTWNEVETTFSELPAPTMRSFSRQWGVLYVSSGNPALITGIITDKKTGLPLEGVSVHIDGVGNKVLSDASGKFSLGTTLYGDLVLIATLKDYTENNTSFTMENGVDMVVNISMVAL